MTSRKSLLLLVTVSLLATLIACGGGSSTSTTPTPISVSLTAAAPSSLGSGATQVMAAAVLNDSKSAGVTWSVTCGSANACGSFSPTQTASGANTTYTAPSAVPTGNTVIIKVTSVTDTTKSASATITIATVTVPITVTLSTTPTALFLSNTTSITATVANDSGNAGVTWSCTPVASCGTFSPSTTLSGIATTYTAPATAPSSPVIITATSVSDTTKSASTPGITIAASGITVTLSPPPPSLPPSASTAVVASVAGDSANGGVTWSCTPVSICGSFGPTHTASTVPSTYTTPSTTGNIVITATSVSDTTQSASTTVTVTTAALGVLIPGNYVFSLSGNDINASYTVSGVFTVDNTGTITGGEQDLVDFNGNLSDLIVSGSVASGSNGNLQITLNTGDSSIGPSGSGTEILDVAPISNSRALITEFDTWATSSGSLDLQATTLATPSGGYAFDIAFPANGAAYAMGGVVNIDSAGGISGNGSVFDMDIFGNVTQNQSFAASTVTAPDPLGRVIFTLFPNGQPEISLAGYMIDANHIRLVEIPDSFGGTFGGIALSQGSATGTFNAGSISGSSYVFGTIGLDINGPFQEAGLLTANLDGSVSGIVNLNDLALISPQGGSIVTAPTYTVDSTGRVTVTGLTDGTSFTTNLQLYLTGDGHALVVSMDNWNVVSGPAFQQTGSGSFTGASFTGVYAMNLQQYVSATGENDGVGQIAAYNGDSLTGFTDLNTALLPVPALPLTGAFTANSNGVFTGSITGIDALSSSSPDNYTYYVADPTKVFGIETDTNQITLGFFELQQ